MILIHLMYILRLELVKSSAPFCVNATLIKEFELCVFVDILSSGKRSRDEIGDVGTNCQQNQILPQAQVSLAIKLHILYTLN